MPLSTLHARPYGRSYMTQGRCDWRGLHHTTLAFATPHRFIPALLPLLLIPGPQSETFSDRWRECTERTHMQTALYLRVSTAQQRPDLQEDGLRGYATRAGLE